jgi:hypothetical protein
MQASVTPSKALKSTALPFVTMLVGMAQVNKSRTILSIRFPNFHWTRRSVLSFLLVIEQRN